MKFTKMHGIGNDYIYVNCFEEKIDDPAELARVVSDRHRGIGGDGLILIAPSPKADALMRIFNADGSQAEMCGNGLRCVAKYAYERKLASAGGTFSVPAGATFPASLKIETGNGILTVGLMIDEHDNVPSVCVNMGPPVLTPAKIPVNLPGETIVDHPIEILGRKLQMTCVSMGNPHAVFFCDDIELIDLDRLGPAIEHDAVFPNRINVHFVRIDGPKELTTRTWERGSGITLACGTGACATAVAAVLAGKAERTCTAHLPGGDLDLSWSEKDDCVYMTGPATEVFSGVWPAKLRERPKA
jgi:diaminopimelate epimerase